MSEKFAKLNIRKKKLIFPLIVTEIIGILVLIWFLRVPLSQKYLQTPPNNYSINSMNPDIQYLLRQGDFISGKTSPNSTMAFWLAPDGAKSGAMSDAEGNFSFQIPENTQPDSYQLIIALDDQQEISSFKDLRIRVESNNIISRLISKLTN